MKQERSAGSTDPEIARLLTASKIHPPEPFEEWCPDAVVAVGGPVPISWLHRDAKPHEGVMAKKRPENPWPKRPGKQREKSWDRDRRESQPQG